MPRHLFHAAVLALLAVQSAAATDLTTTLRLRASHDLRQTSRYTHPIVLPQSNVRIYLKSTNISTHDLRAWAHITDPDGQPIRERIPVYLAALASNDTVWADIETRGAGLKTWTATLTRDSDP